MSKRNGDMIDSAGWTADYKRDARFRSLETLFTGSTWQDPLGRGRPVWHIECSAMIEASG